MYPTNGSAGRLSLRHVFAGLEAGVLGSLFLLGCVMLGSSINRYSVWVVPNLFATTFYGNQAYQNAFTRPYSWVGTAFLIGLYGLLGLVWGCLWRDRRPRALPLYGAVAGGAVYFAFFHYIWNHANGLIILYAPNQQLFFGHILWGLALAKSPKYAQRILREASEPTPASEPPAPQESADQEIKTGEVIR